MEATTSLYNAEEAASHLSDWNLGLLIASCVFAILGVLTNLLLLVAYFKHPELQSPTTLLLVNQSSADLFTCALAPFYLFLSHSDLGVQLTSQNKYLCLVTLCLITLTVWSSLFTLLSLSVDRMLSIRFPFHYARLITEPLIKRFIIGLWVTMVAILSFPMFGLNNWHPDLVCSTFTVLPKKYFVNFLLLSCFIVIVLVGLLNVVICAVVISKRRVHPSGTEPQQTCFKSQYKLTKMLLVVVGVFYACWMPYTVINMLVLLGGKTVFGGVIPEWLVLLLEAAKLLLIVNGAVNPMIYASKVREFRLAFRKTLGLSTRSITEE